MSHLLLWCNAYAQIIRNGKGEGIGLYSLMANLTTVDRDKNGRLFSFFKKSKIFEPNTLFYCIISEKAFQSQGKEVTTIVPIQLSCEEIVHRHGDMVYRIAITQTRHKEDAEDIFQEVFISLMGHIHSIESETHLKHWLIRTTINRCKNHHLCFWKQRVTLQPEQTDSPLPQEEHALIDEVREALAQLPSKLRSPTYLYYYEGYRVEEIATILELPSGTVKSRLHTARGRLKCKLEEAREYE